MLFSSLGSGFRARFLVVGEVLDLFDLEALGLRFRGDRREPSSFFVGEYVN